MYKVLASMRQDMNEGWVWVTGLDIEPRSIIKIKNKDKNRKQSVYCEYLEIDANYIREYNQPPRVNIKADEKTLVINGWYRKSLGGIGTGQNHDLQITPASGLWGKFRASTGHPQIVVRLATWLAIISVALGLLGVCLAFK